MSEACEGLAITKHRYRGGAGCGKLSQYRQIGFDFTNLPTYKAASRRRRVSVTRRPAALFRLGPTRAWMRSLTIEYTGKGDVGGGLAVFAELVVQFSFLIVRKARE